jgi:hypothetical protein
MYTYIYIDTQIEKYNFIDVYVHIYAYAYT